MNRPHRRCESLTRRDMLRMGSLAPLGLGLTDLFRLQAASPNSFRVKAKSCILLWLDGGPSHLETFDLKPDAPAEVRGPFKAISTNVGGIQLCELLANTAKVCDKLAILRSMTSPLGEHGLANHFLMTGYKPSPVIQYPQYGSVVAHVRSMSSVLPPFITIPENRSSVAGFLGDQYEPFATRGDPSKPDFSVRDLDFFPGVDETRILRRRTYLAEFDRAQASFEAREDRSDSAFEKAYRLVTSHEAKRAFHLSEEPTEVRARYGPRMFGQSCLLARRLIERGVPFVSVMNTGWDTHENLALPLRDGYSGAKVGVGLIPTFDQAFSALVTDLSERNLLDDTLVIVMGEFGRTPKLNSRGGRDHWPRVFSIVLAGGGVQGGQVIGSSDRVGESPHDNPITPNDLACTIYTLLGVDPNLELHTADGRPVRVNQGGKLIRGIVRS
ncbi:MAG: DUF1501 domain-containing protein [Planctomycetota bacterium]|nr:DUF1501 domain-containing protein [Planctomycetota bacterium]